MSQIFPFPLDGSILHLPKTLHSWTETPSLQRSPARPHQEELGGLALDDKQVSDLSSALGIMARHRAGKAFIKMPGNV